MEPDETPEMQRYRREVHGVAENVRRAAAAVTNLLLQLKKHSTFAPTWVFEYVIAADMSVQDALREINKLDDWEEGTCK